MRLSDDLLATATLLKRFQEEADLDGGDGRHYALWLRDAGDLFSHHPFSPSAAPDQLMWASEMLTILNRELHHDGAWVVVFTNPMPAPVGCVLFNHQHIDYGKYCLIWVDSDGDCQFTVEWVAGECEDLREFADVLLAGPISTAQKCEAAWLLWKDQRDVLDLRPGQTFKKARGQIASSARH